MRAFDRCSKGSTMDKNNARLVCLRHAMETLSSARIDVDWFSQRDLFYPEAEIAEDGKGGTLETTANAKAWQKSVISRLVDGGVIVLAEAEGCRLAGYRVANPDLAKRLAESDPALHWVLFPDDYDPPSWLVDTEAVVQKPRSALDVLDALLAVNERMIANSTEMLTNQRRIEDRLSKAEIRRNEDRDKSLQLIASATSDLKLATVELTKTVTGLSAQLASEVDQRQALVRAVAESTKVFTEKALASQDRFIGLLALQEKFQQMTDRVSFFHHSMEAFRSTLATVSAASANLEAGIEMAADLTQEIERKSHAS